MSSETLTRQTLAARILTGHLKQNRAAHTYLMTGEKSQGEELALAFAQALNCVEEKGDSPLLRGQSPFSCACPSCRKVANKNHPDVLWVQAAGKSKSIKIEDIREAVRLASLKPYEGKWKVFILPEASRLTLEAANALLKTLEEPPAKTIFILLADSKAHVIETIQSRAFEIRLAPVENENVGARLIAPLQEAGSWDEYLEKFHTASREEIKNELDQCLEWCRDEMENQIKRGQTLFGQKASDPFCLHSYLAALDLFLESKEALDSNVNQKLLLTRLAMQLERVL